MQITPFRISAALALTLLTGLAGGCIGPDLTDFQNASQSCSPGSAILGIFDGFQQIQCGCTEAAGVKTSSLTCTVNRGTTVFFLMPATYVPHSFQCLTDPTLSLAPTDPRNQDNPPTSQAHTFATPGTFQYQDVDSPVPSTITLNIL